MLLGLSIALCAPQISGGVMLPVPLVVGIGAAVVAWAGGVLWMLARLPLRVALRWVMCANLVAAAAVALVSMSAATVLVVVAIVAIAVDVALFAASQAIALHRLPAHA
ncbi:hypothetical protein AUL38_03235 [Leucobacter sp. G161]|nr:hypothetical protein AUL38_03235 [Leucobacter sp. G161]